METYSVLAYNPLSRYWIVRNARGDLLWVDTNARGELMWVGGGGEPHDLHGTHVLEAAIHKHGYKHVGPLQATLEQLPALEARFATHG